MASHRGIQGHQRRATASARRRRSRVAGAGTVVGAFLAFGVTPLLSVPSAQADGLDWIIDPIINSLSGVDPALGADLGALATSIDPSFATENATSAATTADAVLAQAATSATSASPTDFTTQLNQSLEAAEQAWITSSTGEQVDNLLNTTFGETIIGNGAGGTEADPTGGAGGLLFGDGGPGWNSTEAGVAGGNGGDAGIFGDGGLGGGGGAGADGGDGGNGGSLFGIGGEGGNAGDGATADGLPALGGAGGNAGDFGEHGAVGDYGTLPGGPTSTDDGSLLSLGTTGDYLTNSDGQVVIMHGVNEVYKVAPYEPSADGFSDDDAAFLAANGFNVVRLGVIWEAVEPEPGVYNDAYLASIESTVQTLANHGIYTVLDFHQDAYSSVFQGEGAPAWAVETGGAPNPDLGASLNAFFNPAEGHAWDAFWSNTDAPNGIGLEDDYSQMVEHVASYFNGNSDIAGYDLMNEPSPGSSDLLSTLLGGSFFDSQQLTPFYDQAGDAIRAVDPTTPLFYEPNGTFDLGVPTQLGTVDVPGTVFSFHGYLAGDITNAETYLASHNVPAFMGEFGVNSVAGPNASIEGADQHSIGWTVWAYTSQGDTAPGTNPASLESLVYNPELPPTGDNVNTTNLDVLAEPYPQVISGTPDSYSFTNGIFSFSYSTQEADGLGSFPAGAQTTISVPNVEFPDGYTVSVTGGEVVSAPNAADLVIASNAGASTISVTVSPATG